MAAKMERTAHKGIWKRGERYVVRFYDDAGKYRGESVRTLAEARQLKRARESARDRGELDSALEARTPLEEWAEAWVRRYVGGGKRGFSESTRSEYARDLKRYIYPFLGSKRIGSIRPRDVSDWLKWLTDEVEQGKERARQTGKAAKAVYLSDGTVKRINAVLQSCLSSARREGVIRVNPADRIPLPYRPTVDESETDRKALTREQAALFLELVNPRWRTFFRVLLSTGVRWGEATALRWKDLTIDGAEPEMRIRQSVRKGVFKPPKSKHSIREIPLDSSLCRDLRAWKKAARSSEPNALVFPDVDGGPLAHQRFLRTVLRPAAEEAGVGWAGCHTMRHTFASLCFSSGRNVKQVSQLLGHGDPGFTLRTYIHLMDEGVGGAIDLDGLLSVSKVSAGQSDADSIQPTSPVDISALRTAQTDPPVLSRT